MDTTHSQPRILVYGAGAIGGYLGALMAESGADVTLVARGAHLEAMAASGTLAVKSGPQGRERRVAVRAVGPGQATGSFDIILLTLKTTQLHQAADEIRRVLAPGGCIVMIQNGLPWWYFDGVDSPWRGTRMQSLDADGALAAGFDLDRVIGAVIYRPVTLAAPGRIYVPTVGGAESLVIGEIDNLKSDRLQHVANVICEAGFPTVITQDIRGEKWRKLMLNLLWNPLCSLTQSASGRIAEVPRAPRLVQAVMSECAAVAQALGVTLTADAPAELRRVAGNYAQQPSMQQDVRSGRGLEWECMLGAVVEMGELVGVPVPHLETLAVCVAALDDGIRRDKVAIRPVPV